MNNFFRRMLTRDTHHNTSQGENTQNTREVSNNQERPARESAFQTSPWLRRQWDRRTGQMGNAIRRITGNLEPISRNENINTPTENNQIRRWKNKGTPMWDSPSLEQREQKEQKALLDQYKKQREILIDLRNKEHVNVHKQHEKQNKLNSIRYIQECQDITNRYKKSLDDLSKKYQEIKQSTTEKYEEERQEISEKALEERIKLDLMAEKMKKDNHNINSYNSASSSKIADIDISLLDLEGKALWDALQKPLE